MFLWASGLSISTILSLISYHLFSKLPSLMITNVMFLWASGLSISTIGISYHLFSTKSNDN